ncbi:hypothetical protein AB0D04_34280 [Streptomyces sp. NPDC048483]|uniref:hypothetical protein n=1 Tax=Streptomyces sp. NPDC048483 TaxID=3154927 RepID=UPI003440B84D
MTTRAAGPADPAARTAADDPPTTRAIRHRTAATATSTLLLLCLALAAQTALARLPEAIVSWGFPLLYALSCAALLGGCRALARTLHTRHQARVLRTYPWQRLNGVLRRDDDGRHHLVLPHPDVPGEELRLPVDSRFENAPDEVWFAGDPRFLGVLALPGPRRMTMLARPAARDSRLRAYAGPLDAGARARALAVGARVAPPAGALENGPAPVDDAAKVALDHGTTATGLRRSLVRRRIALYGQLAALTGFFVTISLRDDPDPLLPAALVLLLVAPFTLLTAALAAGGTRRLERTLRTYPWQELYGEPEVTGSAHDGEVLVLKPERGRTVRLRAVPLRRRFDAAERFWFAGDLRYGGAVSAPGGAGPVRVVRVKPAKPGKRRSGSPEADALAERAGLTRNGRPRTWAY